MRRPLTILFLLGFFWSFSQDKNPLISLSFVEEAPIAVLNSLEEITAYRFFYVEDWIENKTISGTYEDVPINIVLDDIFKNSNIQFYVSKNNRVYLTRNNIIYDKLPLGFFGKIADTVKIAGSEPKKQINPVFYNEEKTRAIAEVKIVRIGKENQNNSKESFMLSGFAINDKTKEPIQHLSIVVKGKNKGTVTKDDGFYEIELPFGRNVITTRSMGIRDTETTVILYNNGRLDFELQESLEQLDEVVVKGDAAKNVEEAITGTTQIVSEETKNIPLILGERDILKVATTLPGITTAGEGAAGFNVRGGNTDQNLILLDDAVIYNPSHFFGIFQALNPFTTKEATIYKGNIPAKYGGRLSSVFDIGTKDGNTKTFAGEASIGPVTSNIALEIPVVKERSSLVVGGRGTYSGWILRSLDDESLSNSEASFYDVIAKYNHNIDENNDIRATAYFSRDAFSITSDSLFGYSNRLLSLKWDHKFNEKNKGELILSNSEYAFDIDFDGNSTDDFALGYTINETELKLNLKYLYNDAHTFDYGISSKLYAVDPGNINPIGPESTIEPLNIPRERGLESAVFISDNFKVSDQFLIDAGIRFSIFSALGESSQRIYEADMPRSEGTLIETRQFDRNEFIKTYGGPEFRLSARYFLRPDFSIKASFNNTLQYIHTLSNTTTVSPIDTWKLSDSNIEPARANQFSLGLYRNLSENMYELSLEAYYKRSNNVLDFKVGAQLLLNETIETEVLQGEGKAYGIEFLLRKNRGKLNGWLGYSYSRSFLRFDSAFSEERINNGDFFPANFDKPHDISLVANYKLTKRFSLSTNFAYQTGRPVTFPVGSFNFNNSEFVLFSNRNEFRIPDYYRLDIGFNIEGNHKIKKFAHSFWTISIYNVLGRNNPYSVFFLTEDGEVKALQSSIFAIPIPSITYNFKF
ncbi:MAG: carboxypeptidase-like regulatory domain-containing protein [Saonia sp.]